jgi:meiotic recombination protein DMC1
MERRREVEADAEESLSATSIDKLQEHGINAGDINKLKAAGICTVKGLLMVTRKELLNIKGISDQKLDKMLEAAQKSEVI